MAGYRRTSEWEKRRGKKRSGVEPLKIGGMKADAAEEKERCVEVALSLKKEPEKIFRQERERERENKGEEPRRREGTEQRAGEREAVEKIGRERKRKQRNETDE